MAKRSDIEKIVAYENSQFFGNMITHRVDDKGIHYLTIWMIVTRRNSDTKLVKFIKSREYCDEDFDELKRCVIPEKYWTKVDGWDALPNKQVREEFDTED